MTHDSRRPGAVLSPHPDDAVLSAWTTLRQPGDVVVVDVCTAEPPGGVLSDWDRVFGVDESARLVAMRLAEDTEALALAGRTAVHLGYLDAQYRGDDLPLDALCRDIEAAVADAAWLCAPAGIGAHPDHVAVREAAFALHRDAGIPVFLYADVPYAVQWGWPHWVTGRTPRPFLVPEARWHLDYRGAGVAWDRLVAEPRELNPDEVDGKIAALRCYHTQLAALNAGPLDRLFHPEVIGFELRWRVT